MGRPSSVRRDFVPVKTVVGLERIEVGNLASATTSLSDFTILSLEKIAASLA